LKVIWFGLFTEIIILALFKSLVIDFESMAFLAVFLHVFFTIMVLIGLKVERKAIFLGAFLARVIFLIWDLYARNIFKLPNSGADSEMFYNQAVIVSENLWMLNQNIPGELYAKINGVIFYLIGPQRMVGQYINVLLGLSTVYIVNKTLLLLKINSSTLKKILILVAFLPNSLIMSAVFLREMLPTFFVALSIYYFVKWFKINNFIDILLSFVTIGFASTFHSGVIGVVIGYAFVFLFFQREKNEYRFTIRTVLSFVLLLGIVSIGVTAFGEYIFSKFGNIDGIDNIYLVANYREGGSAYLTGIAIKNPLELIIFGPIKGFYFIASPLPINWRNLGDILTFLFDSVLYLGAFIYFIKNRKIFGDRKALAIGLIVMIIGAVMIFGIGVSNAGTALRHRQKLVPVFFVLLAVMSDGKFGYKSEVNELSRRFIG